MLSKFRTNKGLPSHYAFICGHIQRVDVDDNNYGYICLEPNGYHVKGFQNGVHFWDIFSTVAEARKRLNQVKSNTN